MTPRRLRLLEIATVWPLAYILLFLGFMVVWMGGILGLGALGPSLDPAVAGSVVGGGMALFGVVFVLHIGTMLLSLGLMAVHAWLAIDLQEDRTQGLLWALMCVLGGPIGQLLHIGFALRPAVHGTLAEA